MGAELLRDEQALEELAPLLLHLRVRFLRQFVVGLHDQAGLTTVIRSGTAAVWVMALKR